MRALRLILESRIVWAGLLVAAAVASSCYSDGLRALLGEIAERRELEALPRPAYDPEVALPEPRSTVVECQAPPGAGPTPVPAPADQ